MTDESPLFLLTNDDGISSRGLRVLESVASRFGEVLTVAPSSQMSAVSQAITLHAPLRIQEVEPRRFAVIQGTPTDCVYLAIHHLAERKPTWVLSGVNEGLNVGNDIIYSGTVAAAREAALQGIPGIAVSLAAGNSWPVEEIEEQLAEVITHAVEHGLSPRTFLNVNFPSPSISPVDSFRVTRIGERTFSNEVHVRHDPRGREYLWIGGNDHFMADIEGSDCNAIRDGYVSVTPVAIHHAMQEGVASLAEWGLFER